jgi:pimeloyl-ACP methyl ester carboxylesterase
MTASPARGEIQRPDEATIAYDVAGTGPPVLFLHGLTNRRQGWDPVTELLTRDFTCMRVDLRGHGESSTAPDYSMLSLVGDVRAVADELGIEAPAVVGHSLGATAAAVYAALSPAQALVCVDQSLRFGDFAAFLRPRERALREDTMQAVLEIDRELGLGPYEDVAAFESRVRAFPPEVVLGIWEQALTTPPEQLTAMSEALLPEITAPLLALHGWQPPDGYRSWLTALVLPPRSRCGMAWATCSTWSIHRGSPRGWPSYSDRRGARFCNRVTPAPAGSA